MTLGLRLFLTVGLAAAAAWAGDLAAVKVDVSRLARQGDLDPNACAPISVVNALSLGGSEFQEALKALEGESLIDKAQSFISKFGEKPSRDYGSGPRYRPDGVSGVDLMDMLHDAVGPAGLRAVGGYLDRHEGENDRAFLERVHQMLADALRAGRPPILMLRSWTALPDAKAEEGHLWHGVAGHFVTLTRVPGRLADHEWGFAFEYADPQTGRAEAGYVHLERQRNYCVAKGNAAKWEWRQGSAFLLVTTPNLALQTNNQPWFARTLITLNYAIIAESAR